MSNQYFLFLFHEVGFIRKVIKPELKKISLKLKGKNNLFERFLEVTFRFFLLGNTPEMFENVRFR